MSQVTLGMIAGAMALLVPALSHADTNFSLKLEPGIAAPLSTPQADRFNAGGYFAIKGLINPIPWFGFGPSLSVVALPSNLNGVDTGTAWEAGLTAVIRSSHYNDGQNPWAAFSPWVDVDGQAVKTGDLARPAVSAAVGVAVPLDNIERSVWVGPFVRYQNILPTTSNPSLDARNANLLIVGLSIELEPRHDLDVVGESDRDHDGVPDVVDHCPDVPGPKANDGCPWPKPVAPPVSTPPVVTPPVVDRAADVHIQHKVQFDYDSYTLRGDSVVALNEVESVMKANPNYKVRVEGHASSEGTVPHNDVLSLNRAKAVRAWLVNHGIESNRLSVIGFGSRVPIATNSTDAGRRKNRRAEFNTTVTITVEDGK